MMAGRAGLPGTLLLVLRRGPRAGPNARAGRGGRCRVGSGTNFAPEAPLGRPAVCVFCAAAASSQAAVADADAATDASMTTRKRAMAANGNSTRRRGGGSGATGTRSSSRGPRQQRSVAVPGREAAWRSWEAMLREFNSGSKWSAKKRVGDQHEHDALAVFLRQNREVLRSLDERRHTAILRRLRPFPDLALEHLVHGTKAAPPSGARELAGVRPVDKGGSRRNRVRAAPMLDPLPTQQVDSFLLDDWGPRSSHAGSDGVSSRGDTASVPVSDLAGVNLFHLTAVITAFGDRGDWVSALSLLDRGLGPVTLLSSSHGASPGVSSSREQRGALREGPHTEASVPSSAGAKKIPTTPGRTAAYSAAMFACRRGGQGSRAVGLFERMRREGVPCDAKAFATAIAACADTRQHGCEDKCLRLLSEMSAAGVPRNTICYNAVLVALARMGDHERALFLFNAMERDVGGRAPLLVATEGELARDPRSRGERIAAAGRQSEPGVSRDTVTYNLVMRACGVAGEWELALTLFQEMAREGIVRNDVTFNTIIAACVKSGQTSHVERLRRRFNESSANPLTTGDSDQGLQQLGQWVHSHDLLGEAELTTSAFNMALTACAPESEWERALELLDTMVRENVPRDVSSYVAGMTACDRAWQWEHVLELFERMSSDGIAPTETTFATAIAACAQGAQWELALQLLSQMRERGFSANTFACNSAMSACTRAGEWEQALEVFGSMAASGAGCDVVSYGAAVQACARGRKWEKALDLLDEMRAAGIPPNTITYSSAISACSKARRWEEALAVLRRMQRENVPCTVITYISAISACGRGPYPPRWDLCLELLAEMEASNIRPDELAYDLTIQACQRANRWDDAASLEKRKRAALWSKFK